MNLPKIPGLPDGNMVTYALIAAAVLAVVYYLRHPQGQGEGEGEEGGSLPYNPTPVEGGAAGQVAAYESSLSEQISHLREQKPAGETPAAETPAPEDPKAKNRQEEKQPKQGPQEGQHKPPPPPTGHKPPRQGEPPPVVLTPEQESRLKRETGQGGIPPETPKPIHPPAPVGVGTGGQPQPVGHIPGEGLAPPKVGEARPLTGLGSVPPSPIVHIGNPGSRIQTGAPKNPSPIVPRKLTGNNVRRAA